MSDVKSYENSDQLRFIMLMDAYNKGHWTALNTTDGRNPWKFDDDTHEQYVAWMLGAEQGFWELAHTKKEG